MKYMTFIKFLEKGYKKWIDNPFLTFVDEICGVKS